MLSSQCQFVKSKGEEVLLVSATAMDFVVAGVLHRWQGLGVRVCWGGYLLEDDRHSSRSTEASSPHQPVWWKRLPWHPHSSWNFQASCPHISLSRRRGVTMSECKQRWGPGGTSVEATSYARDVWVEKEPVLGRHLGFTQAGLHLTFSNNLTWTSITVGAIKAGGQGAQESTTLPITVFRLFHTGGYERVLEVKDW